MCWCPWRTVMHHGLPLRRARMGHGDRGTMALVRKGSRRIVVDGVPYRWAIRPRPTYSQGIAQAPLTVAVEHAERRGCGMVMRMPQAHPSNWLNLAVVAVRPADVEAGIRAATAQGWKPLEPGSAFRLDFPGP